MNIWLWADRNAAEWDAWQDCRCLGLRLERHQGKYCSQFEEDHMVVIYTQGVRRWCSCNVISMQSRGVRRCSHGEFVMLTYAWYTVDSFITILGHGLYVHMLHPWSVHCCFSISHTRLHSLHHWQPTRHLSLSPALSFHLYYEGFAGKVNIVSHKKKRSIYTPMNYD